MSTMMKSVFFVIVLSLPGAAGLQWTSSSILPNGTTVPACPGQDVTLAWNFTLEGAEHLNTIEWHFLKNGQGNEGPLATQVMGNFIAIPGKSQQMSFLPEAGIRLYGVSLNESGVYAVHLILEVHGSFVREVQTVTVRVSDMPVTTDGKLHISMMSEAVWDNSTQQFHAQLACGQFLPVWGPKVSVKWRTPSNQTLRSTSHDDSQFYLSVPNPVQSGEYTCSIDTTSPASLCVARGSQLERGDTLSVDSVQIKFKLQEARMAAMQAQMRAMQQKDVQLEKENAALRQQDAALKQRLEALRHDLDRKIDSYSQTVSFISWRIAETHSSFWGGSFIGYRITMFGSCCDIVHFHNVTSNIGSAYDASSSVFTAPVNGSYTFHVNVVTDGSVGLMVDDEVVSRYDSSGEAAVPNFGSCHADVFLNQGQRVFVQTLADDMYVYGTYNFTSIGTSNSLAHDVTFSGSLVQVSPN